MHIVVANDTGALGWSTFENGLANTLFQVEKFESRLLSAFSHDVYDAMKHRDVLYHLHHRGIPVSFYEQYPKLADFFKIVSTNIFEGQEVVSTAEAHNYPIYVV